MTTLPDWLEVVDSYDKATEWPGESGYRTYISTDGELRGEKTALAPRHWVRVRSYREGVEAAIRVLSKMVRDNAERGDIIAGLRAAECTVTYLLAPLPPPKPPLKFGEMVEVLNSVYYAAVVTNIGKGNGWFEATRDGGEIVSRRIGDEGKTWRRKS